MRLLCSCCLLFAATATGLAADDSIDEPAVHQTVERSIGWLESDMQTWRNERGCAGCHHGPMYLWSVSVAKRQGYIVNEPQLQELTRWLLTDDEARVFPRAAASTPATADTASAADRMTAAMMGRRNLSQPTIYLAHALNALPAQEPLKSIGWQKVIDHLASAQHEDGSFAGRDAWRPIFNTPQILTRFVVAGIRDAAASGSEAATEEQQRLLEQAEAFLSNQAPDETHQGIVLRLLSEPAHDRSSSGMGAEAVALVDQLMELQRPDGGWSQTDDRESDAFATGQSLAALHRAGVSSTDAAIRRGIDLLLRTQREDGTWPMTSRPNPETGRPAEFLNPITYAATAWATLGLTSCVPRSGQ